MAIPYNPTISELCRTALRRAGQPAPSQGQIGEAISQQFQEVKNDIKLWAPTHPLLKTEAITVTIVGVPEYGQPSDANDIFSVTLFDGPDTWRGTVQSNSSTTIQFESSMSTETQENLQGKMVFEIDGDASSTTTKSFIRSYVPGTKTATTYPSRTAGSSTPTYVIANYKRELYKLDRLIQRYDQYEFAGKNTPEFASIEGEKIFLNRPPDKIYPLVWSYYRDIDQMNETDSDGLWTKILREWRNVFIEGVTAKSMVLYDDTRQYDHMQVYLTMLKKLEAEALTIGQTTPYDPTLC